MAMAITQMHGNYELRVHDGFYAIELDDPKPVEVDTITGLGCSFVVLDSATGSLGIGLNISITRFNSTMDNRVQRRGGTYYFLLSLNTDGSYSLLSEDECELIRHRFVALNFWLEKAGYALYEEFYHGILAATNSDLIPKFINHCLSCILDEYEFLRGCAAALGLDQN